MDWNISRQIVWGIPIPAKICRECAAGHVDLEDKLKICPKCGGLLDKDQDVLEVRVIHRLDFRLTFEEHDATPVID